MQSRCVCVRALACLCVCVKARCKGASVAQEHLVCFVFVQRG